MRYILPAFLFLFAGCGASAIDKAQSTIVTTHHALLEFDTQFAPLYKKARIKAREESANWEELDGKIASWEQARKAMTAVGLSLKTAALAIEIARDGYYSDWEKQIGCVVQALLSLESALNEIDIALPTPIIKIIRTGETIAGPCEKWTTY